MKKALLALADGTLFEGRALGYEGETVGEVVFNTAMTGYQEVLTDPSYKGQIITMTSPHIGNYGVTPEDAESRRIWAEGFIVKEASQLASNWRSRQQLQEYLHEAKIVAIEGLDTRALTRHLREHGSQQGLITHGGGDSRLAVEKAQAAPSIMGRDLATEVTCDRAYQWVESAGQWALSRNDRAGIGATRRWHVVAYDFGVKLNILRRLVDVGCDVTVVPASTTAEQVEALKPDGIFLSNGPGDPEGVPYAVEAVRRLIGYRPIFGICLGHQILGLAYLKTYKLKFGHHGQIIQSRIFVQESRDYVAKPQFRGTGRLSNQQDSDHLPDRHGLRSGCGDTSQSNDHSIEGLACADRPVFSVQYHPEASPGPHDSAYLFTQFTQLMEKQHA
jgi:carbamoyl-phosphate synthase small subunit